MTTRGFVEDDFREVVHRIDEVVTRLEAEKAAEEK